MYVQTQLMYALRNVCSIGMRCDDFMFSVKETEKEASVLLTFDDLKPELASLPAYGLFNFQIHHLL